MEPIPESVQAVEELDPPGEARQLLSELERAGREATDLVPSLIGLSLAMQPQGVTFTVVASDEQIAVLDAMQYVSGGPCVQAVDMDAVVASEPWELLDEQRWQLFARASAAAGVRSTLTIPILFEHAVMGSVNLYASTTDGFDGHTTALAALFGAWAPGAVTNADLSFSTLDAARRAPEQIRDQTTIQTATGVIAGLTGEDVDSARELLRGAARHAGVSELEIARTILETRDL